MEHAPIDLNRLPLAELFVRLCQDEPGGSLVDRLIALARDEDLGTGDLSAASSVDHGAAMVAELRTREPGIAAGLAVVPRVLGMLAPDARIESILADGSSIGPGECLGVIRGPAAQILAAERIVLNLLSRLSGVATRTRAFVDAIGTESPARVYDTRKTTPGLRRLEKYATRCGGAMLHRLGLDDAVMLKDNHLAADSDQPLRARVSRAASRARELARARGGLRFVEVEVDRLEQFEELLTLEPGVIDIVLLDNMRTDQLAAAVRLRDRTNRSLLLEASGGVTLETVAEFARTGVDRISAGSMTHHAVWLDIGLDVHHQSAGRS